MKRYKILIIPPFFPFPPNDGGKICVFGFIDYLRKYHEFHLFTPIRTYDELSQLAELKQIWQDVVIHVVDETPIPSRASRIKKILIPRRFTRLIEFFRRIKIKPRGRAENNPYDFYLNSSNTFPFMPFGNNYVSELTRILARYHFDIIQTELTPMLNLVHLFPPNSKKVFVHIESREGVLNDYGRFNPIDRSFAEYITSHAAFCEYSYMSLYDAVFALNDKDRQTINVRCPNVKVFTSPFAVTDNQVNKIDVGSFRPLHLVFMGGENHFPNYDGLKWFLREVIPQLKIDLPNLYVTGNWKNETISEFSKYYHKIKFTGFVADLAPYLSNSISIVPIRIGGGGIRTKILFAMSNNVPVVSTTLGCEGMQGEDNVHFSIADSALEFAERISDLIKNPTRAKQIIQNAQELIDSVYCQKVVSEKRNSYYHQIMEI